MPPHPWMHAEASLSVISSFAFQVNLRRYDAALDTLESEVVAPLEAASYGKDVGAKILVRTTTQQTQHNVT